MTDVAILASINALRALPAYQAAETLRRGTLGGAGAMAESKPGSDEQRAVLLLISTWQTIAAMISGMKKREGAFRVLPIAHMYRELHAAVKQLGKGVSAAEFDALFKEYMAWLKLQTYDAQYVTALDGGMHACFG